MRLYFVLDNGDEEMATRRGSRPPEIVVPADQPLIEIPDEIDGQEVIRYFFSEEDADAARGQASIEDVLALAGAWSDLDWTETVEALDQIRHGSQQASRYGSGPQAGVIGSMVQSGVGTATGLRIVHDQSLVAVPVTEDGEEVTYYFDNEEAADSATGDAALQAALAAIGSWSDLDWNETVEALDRIRHESLPTPPIEAL
jgi:hypothetical protein